MVPRQMRETFRPVGPRLTYSMFVWMRGLSTSLPDSDAVANNFHERQSAQFRERQAGQGAGLLFRDGPALHGPQERIQQPLAGGGVVEDLADARGLGRLLYKITQPPRGAFQVLQKEDIERGIARGKLGRMQIPALVEALRQGVAHVIVMQFPGAV